MKVNVKIEKHQQAVFDYEILKPKESLHELFWGKSDLKLNPKIQETLMNIVTNVLNTNEESLGLSDKIEDIVLTGSIASYNWHNMSDVDLHVILDFNRINKDFKLVKKTLDLLRINWNKKHNIFIDEDQNHEVEIYFQDSNENHKNSGEYSLLRREWNSSPSKVISDLDLRTAEKKAESLAISITHLSFLVLNKKFVECFDYAEKISNKIKNMRRKGLEEEGIYSPENLAFKMLRNSHLLEKLSFLKTYSYDKKMSLNLRKEQSKKKKGSLYTEIKDYFGEKILDTEQGRWDEWSLEDLLDPDKPAPWDIGDKKHNSKEGDQ